MTERTFQVAVGRDPAEGWTVQALGVPECRARAPRLSDACEQLGELLAARFPGLTQFGLDLVDAIHPDAPDPLAGATVPEVDQRAVSAQAAG